MGYWNELSIRQHEQGWISPGDKYVCGACFDDEDVSSYIEEHATRKVCDYCGTVAATPIAAHIDVLIDLVVRSIRTEFSPPEEELSYESREGGYLGITYSTYELFYDLEFPSENDRLMADVANSMLSDTWCERNYYGGSEADQLIYSWQDFSDIVKHYTRFRFFPEQPDAFPRLEFRYVSILDEIGKSAFELGLVREIDESFRIFRGRVHDPDIELNTAAQLATPPAQKAIYSNRMSPSGIPMFYGSTDHETVVAELFDKDHDPCSVVTIAAFSPVRPLRILDLTSLPEVPSIFSEGNRHLRAGVIFLRGFLEDFAKPIKKDGREHIEYVPSQIVTEFFRHRYVDHRGRSPNGILFPSSRRLGGVSSVLFATNSQCLDRVTPFDFPTEQLLSMDTDSISRIRPREGNWVRCTIAALIRQLAVFFHRLVTPAYEEQEEEQLDIVDYLISR